MKKKFVFVCIIILFCVVLFGVSYYFLSMYGIFHPHFSIEEYTVYTNDFSLQDSFLKEYDIQEYYGEITSSRQAAKVADSIFENIWGKERLLLVNHVSYDRLNHAWLVKSGVPSVNVILSEKDGKILAYWGEKF